MVETSAELMVFTISGKKFAFSPDIIREVIAMPCCTPVPLGNSYLVGLFNYKNEIVPAYSVHKIMGDGSISVLKYCIIIDTYKGLMGYAVESVLGMYALEKVIQVDATMIKLEGELKIISSIKIGEDGETIAVLGV